MLPRHGVDAVATVHGPHLTGLTSRHGVDAVATVQREEGEDRIV